MAENIILEDIAAALNLDCLSDLQSVQPKKLCGAIERLGLDTYTISQWQYAIAYIKGEPIELKSLDAVIKAASK